MAFGGLVTVCRKSHLLYYNFQINLNNISVGCIGVLGGNVQTRWLGRNTPKRRKTKPPFWWPRRKRKFFEEGLTEENKQSIQEVIKNKFLAPGESPLKEPPWEKGEWTPGSWRTGVIAKKIGVYPMWAKSGTRLMTTLLQVVDNHVIKYHPPETYVNTPFGKKYEGKGCIVVGAESSDPQLFTAEYNGLFKEAGVMPKRKLTRFIVTPNAAIQPGTPLFAAHFRPGDYVNVLGKRKIGHGFQGVVKRWGMKGGPKTHGNTKSHRRPGAIGGGVANIWKGKKMPGHMGQEKRILRGLKIWRINTKYNVIWVHGPAVPGHVHHYVYIMDASAENRRFSEDKPPPYFPTYYPDSSNPLPEELYDEDLHNFRDVTITFEDKEQDVGTVRKK
ncbi:large ribosomal subunit protein uL3m-like [Tachypleus tridentatus]|uniref:large ribosomal subunit protein uL3m-like n=1 Tax=Tachypleus tridentatus TaxID=6853 RepID=UPI003FD056C9